MKPVLTLARLGALLLALAALGCNSDQSSEPDYAGSGGSTASRRGTAGASSAGVTAGAGGEAADSMAAGANASAGSAGAPSEATAGTAGAAAVAANAGAAGVVFEVMRSTAGTSAGTAGSGQFFRVRGKVSGLVGTGLSLTLGAGSPLSITANGDFEFPNPVAAGASVTVAVAVQPIQPQQICSVSASGTVPRLTQDVSDVVVTCALSGHAIGGSISGLLGSGLVLQNSTGDEIALGGNGRFAFPTRLSSGQTYTITVKTQPRAPDQTCTVSGGAGTVGTSDVASVTVNCSTNSYTLGGTLSGLVGTGLVLLNNGADPVALTANGSFAFPTPVASGAAFAVTVQTQPSAPAQRCEVSSGTGVLANGNVSSVVVACTTSTFAVRGTVTGLAGTGLSLQNNLADTLAVTNNGQFAFPKNVASGTNFSVTILTQPSSPAQTCAISNGVGAITNEDITNINIACTTNNYSVGGTVVGLLGSGLVVRNNTTDELAITANGAFTFPVQVASGKTFTLGIKTQPSSPQQFCSLAGGHGTIGSANVTTVTVNCSDQARAIGGTITGLVGSGLALALNGNMPLLTPTANGDFAFPDLVASSSTYAVTVEQQPSDPWQTCVLTNGTGLVGSTDISSVAIACTTNSYTVGGSVTGLNGASLVLENLGAEAITVNADGTFVFPTALASGKGYAVTLRAQPTSPARTCAVTNGTGTIGGANITNVQIVCTATAYPVGGTISGLVGTLVLANNGTDTLTRNADGTFAFAIPVASGSTYNVTVLTQPTAPQQICSVSGGTGTVTNANVTDITVVCSTALLTIGGTAAGLAGGEQLVLQNNLSDNLTVTSNGAFAFATPLASGKSYSVTVLQSPANKGCTVSGGTGTVGSANVTSIAVNCSNGRTIGGTVTGLAGTGLVLRNGTENLAISGPGTFAFKTPQADGSTYSVTVGTQPTSPWQTCTVSSGSGVVSGANVSSVAVSCTSNPYSISVNVAGLLGSGLVLQNNLSENLPIAAVGISTFSTPIASGKTYSVAVAVQPTSPNQTCTVASATGTVGNTNVTLSVTCTSNSYTIGGLVAGYIGSGLTLRNNGGTPLSISATGIFTFPTSASSGSSYAVTIGTQPNGFNCAVSNGTGTVGGANVTTIRVNCPAYAFDSTVEGWRLASLPSGFAQPTWTGSVGHPNLGALKVAMPYTPANCQLININVPPPSAVNATGTTLSAWIRFDAFPNSPVSGNVQLYAQDANSTVNTSQYNLATFQTGFWNELSLALPSSGNWSTIKALGIQIVPGSATTCQSGTVYIDSVQLK